MNTTNLWTVEIIHNTNYAKAELLSNDYQIIAQTSDDAMDYLLKYGYLKDIYSISFKLVEQDMVNIGGTIPFYIQGGDQCISGETERIVAKSLEQAMNYALSKTKENVFGKLPACREIRVAEIHKIPLKHPTFFVN